MNFQEKSSWKAMFFRSAVLLSSLWLTSQSFAGASCGAQGGKWNGLIPDSLNAGTMCFFVAGAVVSLGDKSADFSQGCEVHDKCYWTLGANKGDCDHNFKSQLTSECHRAYSAAIDVLAESCCVAYAEVFAGAVRNGGTEAYRDGQGDAEAIESAFTAAAGLPFTHSFPALAAEICDGQVSNGHCLTEVVRDTLLGYVNSIRTNFSELLKRSSSIDEELRFIDFLWMNGLNQAIIRKTLIAEHAPEIVVAKAQSELGINPTEAELNQLIPVVNNFDWSYFEAQFYVTYAKQAVAYFYRSSHGKDIATYWSMYYTQLLINTKDVEKVKAIIINNP